jgi:predicted AlkP superfamily pyrophosphatase or phosphodiesterase
MILAVLLGGWMPRLTAAEGKARHVVVMVWDGMRPDFVTESNCPTLYELSRQGVTFANQHPAYMSATEVNGTALSTGAYPTHDGIVANLEYRPEIDPIHFVHMEDFDVARKGDAVSKGHYILLPTMVEIARKAGLKTAVAGAKPVALLLDRAERTDAKGGANVFAGQTLPADLAETLTNRYGPFPAADAVKPTRNDWTTLALVDSLWEDGVPDLSLLWMSEPDATQHLTQPGSERALAAIHSADDNLARVLRALDEKGVRDSTDVMVVSDHGFSTIMSVVDLTESLQAAGIKATAELKAPPGPGDVVVASDHGAALIYVTGHDEQVIGQVVDFLESWKHTGVILTRKAMPGTFPLAAAGANSPAAPDIMMCFHWTSDKNDSGAPGMIVSDGAGYNAGQGMHGTLSRFDMHNTLIAAGPDFRSGITDCLPSGNVDVAPTVLWILGIKPPKTMDGRILTEALTIKGPKLKSYEPGHIGAARELDTAIWHQYLNFSEVNGTMYYEEGNGYLTPK